MPQLTLDGRPVEVPAGATILDAAERLAIRIPTLCCVRGFPRHTSCFVCVVRIAGRAGLAPACATAAEDGMQVESESEDVREARKTALELLLSDHLGDCVAPCQLACPAGMDIPRMNREIAAGRLRDALVTVKRDIALPAVLGRICPAPCEKACRRRDRDQPVAICLLKRFAADADLASGAPFLPDRAPPTGRRVAVVGAGPAGLAAAYYLLSAGFGCAVLDEREKPGGQLRYGVPEDRLPRGVLDAEIRAIEKLGAGFRHGVRVGESPSLAEVQREFDAVILAVGETTEEAARQLGLEGTAHGIAVNHNNLQTSRPGVFAGGDAVRRARMAVRSVADGKAMAICVGQYLAGRTPEAPGHPFTTRYGRLKPEELAALAEPANPAARCEPTGVAGAFTPEEAREEALRCMDCDCRKQTECRLREWSAAYGARPGHYKGDRRPFEIAFEHPEIVYESGKCISCGICIRIAEEVREPLGLTFIGRGFRVRVSVPFRESVREGLRSAALRCAAACPTGAIARREDVSAVHGA